VENEMLMYLRREKKTKMDVSLSEPIGSDKEGNEILLTDLLGTHDFAAFQKAGSNTNGTVRTIHAINVAVDGSNIDVVVNGNAFLYNMVRIIAGTLVAVGYGKISLSDVQAMLDSGKRKTGIKTLASKGLTLVEVLY